MKSLFLKMFNASDEDDLHKIITSNKYLSNPKNWKPYGNENKNNFATFENQQSEAIPALVEKITNAIDSLLIKECVLKGIKPQSEKAPKTMNEAVNVFYGIKNGDFSEVSKDLRRNIAEDIQLIATGDRSAPNLLIYDNGEGQHPDDFSDTFLSLFKGNKTNIPFVQGKYNMGSTGAVVFCGQHRYQLIMSRRTPELLKKGQEDAFGFTVVRRHPLKSEEEDTLRNSWYEYFVLDNCIPRFEAKEIDLGLWDRKFNSGSIVKLYSYELPRGSRSDMTLDMWRELNQYLYQPALPILLYEDRFGDDRYEKGRTPTKLMLGNKTRITLDENDKKEITISLSIDGKDFGTIGLDVTVFKQDIKQTEFIKDKAVIFTLNGQVHGSEQRRFISQELGFSMLRDSMLIQVDCTYIKTSFRQDLFMASRDRLKRSEKTQILIDKITALLKSNETLKELNQKRKNQIFRENAEDKDLIKSIMSSLPIDKDLINLLKNHGDLEFLKKLSDKKDAHMDKEDKNKSVQPYISKRFPSIFKIDIKNDIAGKKIKSIPLNGKGVIKFETDVENEYLFRPKDKGELKIQILGINKGGKGGDQSVPTKVEDIFEVTKEGPTNQTIKVVFEPKSNVSVGDEIEVNTKLTSPSGDLESIFWIKIIDPSKEIEINKKNTKEDLPNIPTPIKVFEKAEDANDKIWDDYLWTGEDIVKVISENNKIEAIAINMDCFSLKKYISKNRINDVKQIRLVKDKFFVSVYLHSLFLFSILNGLNLIIPPQLAGRLPLDV